jgi:hypothetical protein
MAEWLYSQFGQTKGPISDNALVNMVLKEELELDSYVMNPKDEQWKKIRDIKQLLDKIHEPEAIPHKVQYEKDFFGEAAGERAGNLYFYIPISRLVLMTIVSGGLYQIYWFYKQLSAWSRLKNQRQANPGKGGGRLFAFLTLFSNIENDREMNAVARSGFNGTLLFWGWVLLGGAASGLQYTASGNLVAYLFLAFIGWTFGVLFLLPVQKYINQVNDKRRCSYDKPGFGHYACIIAGIAMLIYTINVRQVWKLFDANTPKQQTEDPLEGFN